MDRPVWRIRSGNATLVVYEIWQGPDGQRGEIYGVLPLSEFGFEIHVAVSFLVSMVGRVALPNCSTIWPDCVWLAVDLRQSRKLLQLTKQIVSSTIWCRKSLG